MKSKNQNSSKESIHLKAGGNGFRVTTSVLQFLKISEFKEDRSQRALPSLATCSQVGTAITHCEMKSMIIPLLPYSFHKYAHRHARKGFLSKSTGPSVSLRALFSFAL